MFHAAFESTSPTFLREARDLRNRGAWLRLLDRHDPLIKGYCRLLRLSGADADEVRQETWIEVFHRLPRFRYDPRQSFRKWLWHVCRSKAVNLHRLNHKIQAEELDDWMAVAPAEPAPEADPALDALFAEAVRVQAAVRGRVEPRSWEAFWLVDVCDWKAAQVADQLVMSVVAVHKAVQRVRAHLREEGMKRPPLKWKS